MLLSKVQLTRGGDKKSFVKRIVVSMYYTIAMACLVLLRKPPERGGQQT